MCELYDPYHELYHRQRVTTFLVKQHGKRIYIYTTNLAKHFLYRSLNILGSLDFDEDNH